MRFLTSYVSDLSSNPHINTLTNSLVDVTAYCVFAGDTFLPDPASYDDLFYKLVETGPMIAKFCDVYSLHPSSSSSTSTITTVTSSSQASKPATPILTNNNKDIHVASIDTLLSVSSHFYSLLFHQDKNGGATKPTITTPDSTGGGSPVPIPTIRKKNLSPREVHRIIKQGYDTLSIEPPDGLSSWGKWRETDWKVQLKRAARVAVDDARQLVA